LILLLLNIIVTSLFFIQYARRWAQWTDYCHLQNLPLYRPDIQHFLGYLATISEQSTVNVVYNHLSAISYYHRIELLPSPSDNEHVTMFMRGLKRIELENAPQPVSRAKALTPEVLLKLATLSEQPLSLRNMRTLWRIFVCYFCLLRWDDVKKLRREDVTYDADDNCYRIKIHPGKTGIIFTFSL